MAIVTPVGKLTSTIAQSIVPEGVTPLGVFRFDTYVSGELIEFDVVIPPGSLLQVVQIGIADTTQIKALMLANIGAANMTVMKLDGGSKSYPLKAGESLTLSGPGIAKKFVNVWSNALTMLQLKISTAAGPATVRLRGIVLMDIGPLPS